MGEERGFDVKNQRVFTIDDKVKSKAEVTDVAFEHALDMTGFGWYNYGVYVISIIMILAMALEIFGSSYVVTACVCDLELTTETKGLVAAMPMLGIVLSSHLWGWLADTRGRRLVLMISMSGCFIGSMLASFSTGWVMLAFFKFIAAFFGSAANSVTYALLGESTPRANRDKLVMLTSSGLMFAQGVMTFMAYPILRQSFNFPLFLNVSYAPWRLLEQVYGAWSGVSVILLLFFVKESPKFYASQGQKEDSVRVLAEIYRINNGKKAAEYPVKSILFDEAGSSSKPGNFVKSMWDQTTPLFRRPLLFNTCIILYIVMLVYSITPAFLMWMPTITNAFSRATAAGVTGANFCDLLHSATKIDLHLDSHNGTTVVPPCVDTVEDLTFITILSFSAATAIANTLNSYIIKFVGKRALVIFLHLLGGVCGLCLPWIYNTNASLIVFLFFQSNVVAMGLTTGFTVEVYPTYLRAMAVCLTMMVGRGASFAAISYVGTLLENHCEATFYGFAALLLSGALVGFLLPSEIKRHKPDTSDSTQ